MDNSFFADVQVRMGRPAPQYAERITGLGHAWMLLGASVMQLRGEIDKPVDERTTLAARSHLVEIAALACRAARDLDIESAADAAHQDIPF